MTDLSLPHETGSEKSGTLCPICGALTPSVTSAYGSISPGACPTCWPAAAPSQLAAQVAAASVPDPVPVSVPAPPRGSVMPADLPDPPAAF
jgi:hypothetical protein